MTDKHLICRIPGCVAIVDEAYQYPGSSCFIRRGLCAVHVRMDDSELGDLLQRQYGMIAALKPVNGSVRESPDGERPESQK